jgi:hypothetical protein
MSEKKSSGSLFSWQNMLLAAAIAGFALTPNPLSSVRPARTTKEIRSLIGDQDVEARLWQDPFEALDKRNESAEAAPSSGKPDHHALSDFVTQIDRATKDGNRVGLLAVMVDGSPYAEGTEARLRARHAILAALGRMRLSPADAEHIGYFRIRWPRGEDLTFTGSDTAGYQVSPLPSAGQGGECVVPFERFDFADANLRSNTGVQTSASIRLPVADCDSVFVLWLREDAFSDYPLPRLAQMWKALGNLPGTNSVAWRRLIGPRSSDGLKRMAQTTFPTSPVQPAVETLAVASNKNQKESIAQSIPLKATLKGFEIFSPWATASDDLLLAQNSPPSIRTRQAVSNSIAQLGPVFHNAAVLDDELARLLLSELALRGVDTRTNRIALLSEWDTTYGRLAPYSFLSALKVWKAQTNNEAEKQGLNDMARQVLSDKGRNISEQATDLFSDATLGNVLRYSYTRGIDGETATGTANPVKGGGAAPAGAEKAEGHSQLDYVRRLAQLLEEKARDGEPFRAIGVLGNDIYDKLVILQALREQFPETIFFTTDLDARLLHSSQNEWTRNLIVASGFGLNLPLPGERGVLDLMSPISPFREGYQTAAFRAGCLALLAPANRPLIEANYPLVPLTFEIGRSLAVQLTPVLKPQESGSGYSASENVAGWFGRPSAFKLLGHSFFVGATVLIITAIVLIMIIWTFHLHKAPGLPLKMEAPLVREPKFWMVLLAAILSVVLLGWWFLSGWKDKLEPQGISLWLEGVSLWPSEAIRGLSACLSAGSIVWIIFGLQQRLNWLEGRFKLGAGGVVEPPTGNDEVDGKTEWDKYRIKCRWHSHLGRAFLLTGCFLIFGIGLRALLGSPFVPFRGDGAQLTDRKFLFLSVLLLIFLMFLVVVATRDLTQFINRIRVRRTRWPVRLLESKLNHRGLPQALVTGWIDVRFFGPLTARVGAFIYCPFTVLFILAYSRSNWFDRWPRSLFIVLIFLINGIIVAICAVVLRRRAEAIRTEALHALRREHQMALSPFKPKGQSATDGHSPKELIEELIREIENYREGAFAPLHEQPLIGALLIPLGGSGSIALLEYLLAGR